MNINYKIKRLLLLSGVVFSLIATARFCHHATKGFKLSKIRSNFLIPQDSLLANDAEKAFISSLFEQKFHFHARGLQSFVFLSDDGKYVLKLFNNHYQKKIQLFSFLSSLPGVRSWASKQMQSFDHKLEMAFKSYTIAFNEMQDKTGLIYMHLSPTLNLPSTLTIVDPLHICHEINPNQMGFLIQKKATLVYPTLQEYMIQQDIEGAKLALSSLVELFFWKWQHKIEDSDPLIRTNYGFIDHRAVQIDVGPLSKQVHFKDFEDKQKETERIMASLKYWLSENAPELIPFLNQELQKNYTEMNSF